MRTVLAIAGLLALTAPALAVEECNYISKLGKFSFVADPAGGWSQLFRLHLKGAPSEDCEWLVGDKTGGEVVCPSGITDAVYATDWDGNIGDDVVLFLDQKWVKNCFEPV